VGNSISGGLVGSIVATNFLNQPNPQGGSGLSTTLAPTTTCHPPLSIDGFYPLFNSVQCAVDFGNGTYHTHSINGVIYYMPEGVPSTHGTTTTLAPVVTTLAPVVTTLAPVGTPNPPSDVVVTILNSTTLAPTTLAPVATTLAPVATTLAPVATTLAPVATTLAPTTLAPVVTTLAPIYATTPPPTTTLAPTPENWSPESIPLISWHDASDICSIVDSSGIISKWRDKSGNDNLLTANNNPTTGISSENSLNVIDFDGDDSFSNLNFSLPSSGNLQAFIVCEITENGFSSDSILTMNSTSNDFQIDAGASEFKGRILTDSNGDSGIGSNKITGLHVFCATFDFNLNLFTLRLDGDQMSGTSVGNYTTKLNQTQQLRVFANRGNNNFPEGRVAEVIILEDVSESIRQKIEGYLSHKWGLESELDSSHPFKTSTPTEIILPVDHPYSLTMANACSAGGIDFIESALDLRMTSPTIGGEGFFEQGGKVLIFSKEDPTTPEEIEPTSDLPTDLNSIDWLDYFPDSTQLSIDNFSSFYSRTLNDFGVIKPQSDQVWLSFKYYFINNNAILYSGNCEIFTDHPTCTTTSTPTTTLDPAIPTTTLDPAIPTTTPDPVSYFPTLYAWTYGGCFRTLMDESDEFHVNALLGIDSQWTTFAIRKWIDDGEPTGEYFNYIEKYSMNNHVVDFKIWQGQNNGLALEKTIALSSADFGFYNTHNTWTFQSELGRMLTEKMDIDLSIDLYFGYEIKLRHHANDDDGFAIGEVIPDGWHDETSIETGVIYIDPESLCNPPTSTTLQPYNPTTTCTPPSYASGDQFYDSSGVYIITNQGWWYDTCQPTYDLIFYDYANYDACNYVGLGGGVQSYGVTQNDLDSMTQSTHQAELNGWLICSTTTTSTTIDPSSFSVGDYTQWYGVSVQIVGDNGDGTYNIDNNGSINYNIIASSLGTDINGNPI
jgi:hypothetical protein